MQLNGKKTKVVAFSSKKSKPCHLHVFQGNAARLWTGYQRNYLQDKQGQRWKGTLQGMHASRGVIMKCDIIYHYYDPKTRSYFTLRVEQRQYSAALAITAAWKGTDRQRLYEELH